MIAKVDTTTTDVAGGQDVAQDVAQDRAFLLDQRTTSRNLMSGNRVDTIGVDRQDVDRQVASTTSTFTTSSVDVVDLSRRGYNTMKLNTLAKVMDRYQISNRAGSAIASAALIDDVVTPEYSTKLIDKTKLKRARELERNACTENQPDDIESIYFDGRKDRTLKFSEGKICYVNEEHVVIIAEPGKRYFGHVSPPSSSAANISNSMIELLAQREVPITQIRVVGCDGTPTNTGNRGGVIVLLEAQIGSPVQWFICQLHANELPLRHLIIHLDGTSQGPRAFNGPIGKQLPTAEKHPVVLFEAIKSELPIILKTDLSSDQHYLYDMVRSISVGTCSRELLLREPGQMCHSRWLTTANRILRLYVATHNPHPNLITLVVFIVKVYAPMWFYIKRNPSCFSGSINLHKTIKASRYLPENLKAIIDPVIQRNGYFGHPENILLAMMLDENKEIRQLALRRILEIRGQICHPKIQSEIFQSKSFHCFSNFIDIADEFGFILGYD